MLSLEYEDPFFRLVIPPNCYPSMQPRIRCLLARGLSISTDDPISFGGVQVEQSQTPFSSVLAGDLFCVFQILLHSKCSMKGRSGVKREVGLSFQPSSSWKSSQVQLSK